MNLRACLIITLGAGAGGLILCCLGGAVFLAATGAYIDAAPKDPLDGLRADLDWRLSNIDGADFISVDLSNRKLTVEADLGPVSSETRIESTGTILSVIADHHPAADWIHIETPAGQCIAVSMQNLMDYRAGRLTIDDFMMTWRITKE